MTIFLAIVLPPCLSYEGDSYLPEFDVLDDVVNFWSKTMDVGYCLAWETSTLLNISKAYDHF